MDRLTLKDGDIEAKLEAHHSGMFLSQSDEPFHVLVEADVEAEERTVSHFGDVCPLDVVMEWQTNKKTGEPLKDGCGKQIGKLKVCKTYNDRWWKCRSVVCTEFSYNYLAHHGYASGNHPKLTSMELAFEAANECIVVTATETFSDRQWYRAEHGAEEKETTASALPTADGAIGAPMGSGGNRGGNRKRSGNRKVADASIAADLRLA